MRRESMTYEGFWRYLSHSTERPHGISESRWRAMCEQERYDQWENELTSLESANESFDIGERHEDILRDTP